MGWDERFDSEREEIMFGGVIGRIYDFYAGMKERVYNFITKTVGCSRMSKLEKELNKSSNK